MMVFRDVWFKQSRSLHMGHLKERTVWDFFCVVKDTCNYIFRKENNPILIVQLLSQFCKDFPCYCKENLGLLSSG